MFNYQHSLWEVVITLNALILKAMFHKLVINLLGEGFGVSGTNLLTVVMDSMINSNSTICLIKYMAAM